MGKLAALTALGFLVGCGNSCISRNDVYQMGKIEEPVAIVSTEVDNQPKYMVPVERVDQEAEHFLSFSIMKEEFKPVSFKEFEKLKFPDRPVQGDYGRSPLELLREDAHGSRKEPTYFDTETLSNVPSQIKTIKDPVALDNLIDRRIGEEVKKLGLADPSQLNPAQVIYMIADTVEYAADYNVKALEADVNLRTDQENIEALRRMESLSLDDVLLHRERTGEASQIVCRHADIVTAEVFNRIKERYRIPSLDNVEVFTLRYRVQENPILQTDDRGRPIYLILGHAVNVVYAATAEDEAYVTIVDTTPTIAEQADKEKIDPFVDWPKGNGDPYQQAKLNGCSTIFMAPSLEFALDEVLKELDRMDFRVETRLGLRMEVVENYFRHIDGNYYQKVLDLTGPVLQEGSPLNSLGLNVFVFSDVNNVTREKMFTKGFDVLRRHNNFGVLRLVEKYVEFTGERTDILEGERAEKVASIKEKLKIAFLEIAEFYDDNVKSYYSEEEKSYYAREENGSLNLSLKQEERNPILFADFYDFIGDREMAKGVLVRFIDESNKDMLRWNRDSLVDCFARRDDPDGIVDLFRKTYDPNFVKNDPENEFEARERRFGLKTVDTLIEKSNLDAAKEILTFVKEVDPNSWTIPYIEADIIIAERK